MPQNHAYTYHICWAWYNGSYTIATKPIKFLELHYTMTQFLITWNIQGGIQKMQKEEAESLTLPSTFQEMQHTAYVFVMHS